MSSENTDRPPFSQWITQPQTVVALSALLLSVCGLFIAIYEASLIRRAQRASVWPHVHVAASISGEGVELWVQNTGVGPARVRAAAVSYQGETKADWSALLASVVDKDLGNVGATYSLINGRVLALDSRREIIYSVTEDRGPAASELIAPLGRAVLSGAADVTVCYCSVFDECWTTSLQDMLRLSREAATPSGPREVDDCDSAQRSGI